MEMIGEQIIALPQREVWEALNDPAILKQCIPGCETVEMITDSEYKMAMVASIGPVKAKFSGKLTLTDVSVPDTYTLHFEGTGGVAGFGKGSCQVTLSSDPTGTKLSYNAKASVGGKIAQIGSRLVSGAAKKIADQFFAKFNEVLVPTNQG
ncbi:MAG: carbon monoxide dehydrogenase [Betaproteobacteria bacterium]|nr:carbon monoxide dehydrogenase [Betaproteobacteria bacterium]